MKLSKHLIVTLIEEALKEASFNPGSPDYKAGLGKGMADGRNLSIQHKGESLKPDNDGNTPLKDKILDHLADETAPDLDPDTGEEVPKSNDYIAGYEFGFKLYWSTLDPPTVTPGQLPFANTRTSPSDMFNRNYRNRSPLKREGKIKTRKNK